jgi:hypothetical protein
MNPGSFIQKYTQNLAFLYDCILGYSSQVICPDCRHIEVILIDRKFIFARLFECQACRLRFRHPLDNQERLETFYQSAYVQGDGITTHLPTRSEWECMVRNGFEEKSVAHYISLIKSLFPNRLPADIKVMDYGCSWGYQTWQFLSAGFDCTGFEISVPRASYGRENLGLTIYSEPKELVAGYDIFFASHVIEHVSSPVRLLDLGYELLKPGGYMIVESPNGSDEFRKTSPKHFHKLWGRVHPFMMSPTFYGQWLSGLPAYYTSSPFEDLRERSGRWDKTQNVMDRLDGPSMLMINRKT